METTFLRWKHPYRGEIGEEVCQEHELEVRSALQTLGIGMDGKPGKVGICWRCIYDGFPFREWMDQLELDL